MNFPVDWTPGLINYFSAAYGTLSAIEKLGGKSGAEVFRVRFSGQSVIVKKSFKPQECNFYQTVAPVLEAVNVPIPELKWVGHTSDAYWLVLEDIPYPLPRSRWQADPEKAAVLRRLHSVTPTQVIPSPDWYKPKWDREMSERALEYCPAGHRSMLAPKLFSLQEQSQYLFEPRVLISADTNPLNWGLREDGTLVLFDWERISFGTPALDLAISVGGLGDKEIFAKVADLYLTVFDAKEEQEKNVTPHPSPLPSKGRGNRTISLTQENNVGLLAQDIRVAKIWNVVEYLSMYWQGEVNFIHSDSELQHITTGLIKMVTNG